MFVEQATVWQHLVTLFKDPDPQRTEQRREVFARPILVLMAITYLGFYAPRYVIANVTELSGPIIATLALVVAYHPVLTRRVLPYMAVMCLAINTYYCWVMGLEVVPLGFFFVLSSYMAFSRWRSLAITLIYVLAIGGVVWVRQVPAEGGFYIGFASVLLCQWWLLDAIMLKGEPLSELMIAARRTILATVLVLVFALAYDLLLKGTFDVNLVWLNSIKMLLLLLWFGLSYYLPRVTVWLAVSSMLAVVAASWLAVSFEHRTAFIFLFAIATWFLYLRSTAALLFSCVALCGLFAAQTEWLLNDGFAFTWRYLPTLTSIIAILWYINSTLAKHEPSPSPQLGLAAAFGLDPQLFKTLMLQFAKEALLVFGALGVLTAFYAYQHTSPEDERDRAALQLVAELQRLEVMTKHGSSHDLATGALPSSDVVDNMDLISTGNVYVVVDQQGRLLFFLSTLLAFLLAILVLIRNQILYRSLLLQRVVDEAEEYRRTAQANTRQLQQANAVKERFLNNVSRNMRMPLNSVFGAIEIFQQNINSDQKALRQPLEILQNSSQRLLQMVVSVLDVSKLFSGDSAPVIAPYGLSALTHDLWPSLREKLAAQGGELALTDTASAVPNVLVDKAKLLKIIELLAVELTQLSQGASIAAHYDVEQEFVTLTFTVEGAVIPGSFLDALQVNLPHAELMQQLLQLENTDQLSLNLCRTLMRLMHCELEVSSEQARGTQVILRMPREPEGGDHRPLMVGAQV